MAPKTFALHHILEELILPPGQFPKSLSRKPCHRDPDPSSSWSSRWGPWPRHPRPPHWSPSSSCTCSPWAGAASPLDWCSHHHWGHKCQNKTAQAPHQYLYQCYWEKNHARFWGTTFQENVETDDPFFMVNVVSWVFVEIFENSIHDDIIWDFEIFVQKLTEFFSV